MPTQWVWGAIITCTRGAGCYNYLHSEFGVLLLPAQVMYAGLDTPGTTRYYCSNNSPKGGVGCHNYLHRRSLGGAGCGVTTKCLSGLESLAVLDVLYASLVRLGVVGVLVGQVVQGVVDGAGVPHLLHGPLIGVTALQVHQHTEVQYVDTGEILL